MKNILILPILRLYSGGINLLNNRYRTGIVNEGRTRIVNEGQMGLIMDEIHR